MGMDNVSSLAAEHNGLDADAVNMVRDQIEAILEAAGLALIPVTMIAGGRVSQVVEIVKRKEQPRIIQP